MLDGNDITTTNIIAPLKKRADFLKICEGGFRIPKVAFILIARKRDTPPLNTCRIGYTASKKVGNAVARNKAKRRMRAIVANTAKEEWVYDFDYVIICKNKTVTADFNNIKQDFAKAVSKIKQISTSPIKNIKKEEI